MPSIREKRAKKVSILNLAVRLYKKRGLKFLMYSIAFRLSWESMKFLNKRSIPASNGYLVKEILGSKMYLDAAAGGLHYELLMDGIREAYITEAWQKEIRKGDIVVDIGANVGYYALLEAKIVGEEGTVYAIEPVPENIELLKRNIELNKYKNIETYQLAMGNKNGSLPMYVAKPSNLSGMKKLDYLAERGMYLTREINVETMTLDHFLKDKPYPDIIRMDVEGYEYEIVEGMKRTLETKLPLKMFIEFHFSALGKEKSLMLLQTLKEAGFEIAIATIEQRMIVGACRHKTLANIVSFLDKKRGAPSCGYVPLTIDDIISNDTILNGDWEALEICFKRL